MLVLLILGYAKYTVKKRDLTQNLIEPHIQFFIFQKYNVYDLFF